MFSSSPLHQNISSQHLFPSLLARTLYWEVLDTLLETFFLFLNHLEELGWLRITGDYWGMCQKEDTCPAAERWQQIRFSLNRPGFEDFKLKLVQASHTKFTGRFWQIHIDGTAIA